MLKLYMLIVVVGLVGGVVYGGYYYYKDTQSRIQTLTENNAKVMAAKAAQDQTINTLIADRDKFDKLNKELHVKLEKANEYKDTLINKLRKHDLAKLSMQKPGLVEKKINRGTENFLFPFLLLSSGCSSWRDVLPVEIKTVEVERKIPTQNRPKPIKMNNIHFYVVTEDTWDSFKERFAKENGDLLFYALSVRDYESLALNMADLKRYIQQQKEIIVYYEEAVKPIKKEDNNGKSK
jgi:hypothetical protein